MAVISEELLLLMMAHATRDAPLEACGLLLGDESRIRAVCPARNELADARRYRIDPRDHFAAVRRAREEGMSVVGAFHSHPRTPAEPSETDLREAWPDFLYVIVSLDPTQGERAVRAWQLADGRFMEVSLEVGAL